MMDTIIFLDSVLFNMTGLLFIVLGVFLLIRIAGFPDLTVDGSFSIGAAVYATLMVNDFGIIIALIAAALSGAVGGVLTWTLNHTLGIGKVVSGILSMIILILSAPYITGGASQSLLKSRGFFQDFLEHQNIELTHILIPHSYSQLHLAFTCFWFSIFAVILFYTYKFLKSPQGIKMRYLGTAKNATLLLKTQKNTLLLLAMALGNAMVALGGAIEAERRGGYTNNMGMGMLLVALTALVLGEGLFKSYLKREYLHLKEYIIALLTGTLIYCTGIQWLLYMQLDFVDIRLLSALFLIVLLGLSGKFYSNSSRLF